MSGFDRPVATRPATVISVGVSAPHPDTGRSGRLGHRRCTPSASSRALARWMSQAAPSASNAATAAAASAQAAAVGATLT